MIACLSSGGTMPVDIDRFMINVIGMVNIRDIFFNRSSGIGSYGAEDFEWLINSKMCS